MISCNSWLFYLKDQKNQILNYEGVMSVWNSEVQRRERAQVIDAEPSRVIDAGVRDRMALTFRNTVNNFARDSEANTNIHYASKFAVLGAFVSVVGALESVAILVSTVVTSFFAFFNDGEDDSDWNYIPREQAIVDNSQNLLGYHLTNIATLGFFGFSVRDKALEKRAIEPEAEYFSGKFKIAAALDAGDAYGLVDVKPQQDQFRAVESNR